MAGGSFKEERAAWQPTDFRFTTRDGAVYAFMMRCGGSERAVIEALGKVDEKQIASVVSGRPAEFLQKDGALLVGLPGGLDRTVPVCIKAAF